MSDAQSLGVEPTLIDSFLEAQRCLTAVERFARRHERRELPVGEVRYRSLLPLSAPGAGQQFAFEVDLDRCSGCKSCVAACHSLNGLDTGEVWRSVGALVSDDWRRPFQQTVTTACHHCVDPGCMSGCPVLAYEKHPVTGIVRHLDDQCIGCQYCVLMCPYDVPQYSAARGIVRKCDMCSQRLAAGEAPACVQACPHEAIRITVVQTEHVRDAYRRRDVDSGAVREVRAPFLPAAPDPAITLPTTRYVSKQPLAPELGHAGGFEPRLQPAHGALVWMLVWTQLSAGAYAGAAAFTGVLGAASAGTCRALVGMGLVAAVIGLAGSGLHLGRPGKAWRAFLGWRTSWLSREVAAMGVFLLCAMAVTCWLVVWEGGRASQPAAGIGFGGILLAAAALAGCGVVFFSAMVYHATRRVLWVGLGSAGRFFGTAAVLGLAAAWVCAAWGDAAPRPLPLLLAFGTTVKLAWEHRLLRRADTELAEGSRPPSDGFDAWSLAQSALLMLGRLGVLARARILLGVVGGVLAPLLSVLPGLPILPIAGAALGCCLAGEFAERYLFFRCVVPPRMPGGEAPDV